MSKIYCSIGKVPKGKRLGSMKECIQANQIRYYGVKKIDPKLLKSSMGSTGSTGSKKKGDRRTQVILEISKLKGKMKKIQNDMAATKKDADKEKLKKDYNKLVEVYNKLAKEFAEIEKKKKQKRNSSTRSRSRSRLKRTSGPKRARTGSRKSSRKRSNRSN